MEYTYIYYSIIKWSLSIETAHSNIRMKPKWENLLSSLKLNQYWKSESSISTFKRPYLIKDPNSYQTYRHSKINVAKEGIVKIKIKQWIKTRASRINDLFKLYNDNARLIEPNLDQYRRNKKVN